jgi:hypothetical protein
MTRLTAVLGLVVQEKINYVRDRATHLHEQGQRVRVLDHIARLPIDPASVPCPVQRINGTIQAQHIHAHTSVASGIDELLLAVSETAHPDEVFATLAWLDTVQLTTVALIDTRTCDCFPHVREKLEALADSVIHLPYDRGDLLL